MSPSAFQLLLFVVYSWSTGCVVVIMIDEVEEVRIPPYQSFETLSLAKGQREDGHLSQGHVMYFGSDLADSVPLAASKRTERIPRDSKLLKLHGFLPSNPSWISTDASESGAVNQSKITEPLQSASAFFTDEMTPEFAFTQYQRRSEDQACQVCGQPSVGFHHRAYVCEACKKFFTRHLTNRIKKEKSTFGEGDSAKSSTQGGETHPDLNVVCPMGGNCKIEGPGRGKCPHCRFRKCLDLGMSLTPPGGEIGCDVSKIPCRVCGGPSSGFHFGALTCEGCKGFFRRTVHSNSIPQCLGNQTCRITPSNRNMCKSCRFKKCLEVGMSQKRSRVGRQPNAIKYYCVREISQREQNGGLPSPDDSSASKGPSTHTNHVDDTVPLSPRQRQTALLQTAAGAPKRSLNTFETVDATVVPMATAIASVVGAVPLTADLGNATDSEGTRSRASTLSASSGVLSSSAAFQNPLDAQQTSPIISSISSLKRPKVEDTQEHDAGTDMVDSSFCQQLASVTVASSLANHFLLNPQFASGSCSSQLRHPQPTPTAEFLSQLAKHHPTMVAAAAASLLWGNPSNGPVFESEHTQTAVPSPPQLSCCSSSSRFHPHQSPAPPPTLPTALQPVDMVVHSCLRPLETKAKQHNKTANQSFHDDVVREGSEAASSLEESIRTNVFVTLAEFTQGIERATDFLRSERIRLKRIRTDPQPRFTNLDTIERVWSQMMRQFVSHTRMVVDFSKLIAGFNRLGINDRRQLIRAAMYPIMLIELSRDFQNNSSLSYNYFDFPEREKEVIIQRFPPLAKMISHLVQSGKVLRRLKLDDIESTIICIQELLRHKNELEDPASCEHLFLLSMQALVNHEHQKSKSDAASERLTAFTQLLPILNQLNVEHHEVLSQVRLQFPHLVFPELYVEMFAIGADKPPHFFRNDSNRNDL
ncbi:nuclear receptor 2DBD gamma [Echinococcus multilocularis]|uniref:Nuclear receptor 2DBD gamma n=1 Tax=Echinococcus multilocularis TaxID=6211 RepID=A0A068XYP2_ECHMU|nr:nuclear receptor 2DBD gamma [Echinococcus multilocularis]